MKNVYGFVIILLLFVGWTNNSFAQVICEPTGIPYMICSDYSSNTQGAICRLSSSMIAPDLSDFSVHNPDPIYPVLVEVRSAGTCNVFSPSCYLIADVVDPRATYLLIPPNETLVVPNSIDFYGCCPAVQIGLYGFNPTPDGPSAIPSGYKYITDNEPFLFQGKDRSSSDQFGHNYKDILYLVNPTDADWNVDIKFKWRPLNDPNNTQEITRNNILVEKWGVVLIEELRDWFNEEITQMTALEPVTPLPDSNSPECCPTDEILTFNNSIASDNYRALTQITTTAGSNISGNKTVTFKAGNKIELCNLTVDLSSGGIFTAEIKDLCPSGTLTELITPTKLRINSTIEEAISLAVQPNPFHSTTNIVYTLPSEKEVSIHVTDLSGRIVKSIQEKEIQGSGNYTLNFNANQLMTGTYLLHFQTNDFSKTEKLVVLGK